MQVHSQLATVSRLDDDDDEDDDQRNLSSMLKTFSDDAEGICSIIDLLSDSVEKETTAQNIVHTTAVEAACKLCWMISLI